MTTKKTSSKVDNLYLIPELENREFENQTLISTSKEIIDTLIETKELQYITKLSSFRTIYKEDIFWKQIMDWRIREFDFRADNNPEALKDIENIQASICKGFKKVIKSFKPTKQGKPPKQIKFDIDDYIELQSKLHNCFGELEKDASIDFRRKSLKDYLENNEVLNKKIVLDDKEINELSKKTVSKIAKHLISKVFDCSVITVKRKLAEYGITENSLKLVLPNGKTRYLSNNKYIQVSEESIEIMKKEKMEITKENLSKLIADKLNLPQKSIIPILETYMELDLFHVNKKPHKERSIKKLS